MGENVKRRAKRCEVKARVLHHVLTSDYCVAELAEQYDISVRTLYRWIKEDAVKPARRKGAQKRGRMAKEDYKDKTIAELEKKVQDLQAALSEKVLENCALQAIVNVTERKYGISAKKKTGSLLSPNVELSRKKEK